VCEQAAIDLLTLLADAVDQRWREHHRGQEAVTQLRTLLEQLPGVIAARSDVLEATAPAQTPWFAAPAEDGKTDLAERVLAWWCGCPRTWPTCPSPTGIPRSSPPRCGPRPSTSSRRSFPPRPRMFCLADITVEMD
jgi:hypothetical protein